MRPNPLNSLHPTRRDFLGTVAAGTAMLGGAGCTAKSVSTKKTPPSVVLVVLDTVRASSCGRWGYHRNTTPNLDDLVVEGSMYAQAISTAPWTLPSHVSLFTGEYTLAHGVRGYVHKEDDGTLRIRENTLPMRSVTLAERLYHGGYATGAFTANTGYLAPHFNLTQGFETYEVERIPGVDLVQRALTWRKAQTKPSFLFCNIMDAHRPYNTLPLPDSLPMAINEDPTLLDQLREKTLSNPKHRDAKLAAAVLRQYDRGIGHADRALGTLIEGLKSQGDYDNTVIIVCADHGEYLGEHGLVEHSKDIYQETIHVPLVVRAPGQRQSQYVTHPVSLSQVPGTIIKHVGIDGTGLPPALDELPGDYPVLSENYFSRDWDFTDPRWAGRFNRIRRALFMGDWKLIRSSDGDDGLYDLVQDPKESRNRRDDAMGVYRSMCERIDTLIARAAPKEPVVPETGTVPETTQEALQSLGYL